MAGRTPEEAVETFLDPLRQAALCITTQPLLASGYRSSVRPHVVAFAPQGFAVPFDSRFGHNSISLFISQRYRIMRSDEPRGTPWEVHPVAYDYSLLTREGGEVLVYHWHPEDVGPTYEHMHLSGKLSPLPIGERLLPVPLGDMHIPTDHVPFGSVVRLLIDEFGVPALKPERDWRSILELGDAAFKARRRHLG